MIKELEENKKALSCLLQIESVRVTMFNGSYYDVMILDIHLVKLVVESSLLR